MMEIQSQRLEREGGRGVEWWEGAVGTVSGGEEWFLFYGIEIVDYSLLKTLCCLPPVKYLDVQILLK